MSSSLTWIPYAHGGALANKPTEKPGKRRSHRKSRTGCLVCKRRRVKCDEKRPSCGQCFSYHSECHYAEPPQNQRSTETSHQTAGPTDGPICSQSFPTVVSGRSIFATSLGPLASAQNWRKSTPEPAYVRLLSYFHGYTASTLSSPTWQRILKEKTLNLIQSYPFFSHALLAFTASHLTCVSGQDTFAATALYHTQQALELYGGRLHRVKNRTEMDAMLAACFMLTALFYLSHERLRVTDSWIFANKDAPSKPHWSTIISGPTLLIQSKDHTESISESLWFPFTNESYSLMGQAREQPGPGEQLVTLLKVLCLESRSATNGSPIEDTTSSDTYLSALEVLIPALRMHFDPFSVRITPCTDVATYILLMAFPSRMNTVFVERLSNRDPLPLLLVGFWLALLSKLQHCQWWCLWRALSEGSTILYYLGEAEISDTNLKAAVNILSRVFY